MNDLIQTLTGIVRLRAGPQDLPVSWPLTLVLLTLSVVISAQLGILLEDKNPIATSLVATALQFAAIYIMLQFRGSPERCAQTVGAFAGANVIIGTGLMILLPMADPQQNQPILFMLSLSIFVWSFVIDAHIFRHALAITMAQGVLVAVLLFVACYVTVEFLFMTGKAQG